MVMFPFPTGSFDQRTKVRLRRSSGNAFSLI
ncbi:MAG: hypothetical protein RLZZ408_822, partial [Verrucomicrobiota bacterium]